MLDDRMNVNEWLIIAVVLSLIIICWYIFHPALIAASNHPTCTYSSSSSSHHRRYASKSKSTACTTSTTTHKNSYYEVSLNHKNDQKWVNANNEDSDYDMHTLSLIIPAYNEEVRLPIMLDDTIKFLHGSQCHEVINALSKLSLSGQSTSSSKPKQPSIEIVIVDDGSSDGTADIVMNYAKGCQYKYQYQNNARNTKSSVLDQSSQAVSIEFRLIRLKKNQGKGAAIRTGMLESNSHYLLMVDADGATNIHDLLTVSLAMNDVQRNCSDEHDYAIIIGSRAHLAEESTVKRTIVRNILMYAFHFFVSTLCSNTIKDTQCGFKLFTRSAAILLFSSLHLERWAFDIEILTLAEKLSIPMVEVGVKWQEIDGSKLDTSKIALLIASVGMLRDMVCINLCYTFGIWKMPKLGEKRL